MVKLIKEKVLENKISVIIIIILSIIIIVLQTKLTSSEAKIKNLNIDIEKFKENSNEIILNKVTQNTNTRDTSNEKDTTYFEDIKQRFIEIGKTKNKIYDDN